MSHASDLLAGSSEPASSESRAFSTRAHLLALAIALVAPVLAVSAWLAAHLYASERSKFEQSARETARLAATLVEREIASMTRTLQVLALSDYIVTDFEGFRRKAIAAAAIKGANITLRDRDSRQVVNSAVPLGQTPPDRSRLVDIDQEVLRTGEPSVSNYYVGLSEGVGQVAVVVPVKRDGEILYLLSGGIPVARIRQQLRVEGALSWRTEAIDRNGISITRLRDPDTSGEPAAADWWDAVQKADSGFLRFVARDGASSISAFAKTSFGWTIGAGASEAELIATLNRTLLAISIGALGLLALAFGLAFFLARRISRPVQALEAAGQQLARGERVSPFHSGNREANSLARSLSEASFRLLERDAALRESDAAVRRQRDFLENLITRSPIAVAVVEGADLRFTLVNPAYQALAGPQADLIGRAYRDAFPGPTGADAETHMRATMMSGQPWRVEDFKIDVPGRAETSWWEGEVLPLHGHAPLGALLVLIWEITDRKRAESVRELMINELNHRVKNTLATVQSLAAQTLRNAPDLRKGEDAFVDRLLALSRAHDVLTQQSWESADIRDIVHRAVAPHEDEAGAQRFGIAGPNVSLDPKAALALSLALHELCTNALKYGALSNASGVVSIRWEVQTAGGRRLHLIWREQGGPPVVAPLRRGFGSRLIERSLAADLAGEVKIDFAPDGVVCTIAAPLAPAASRPALRVAAGA